MKKILSLVLVLMVCVAMTAVAEQADQAVPSPTTGPKPVVTEQDNVEFSEKLTEEGLGGATNATFAPAADILALIQEARTSAQILFANDPKVYQTVADMTFVGATIATVRFDVIPAGDAANQVVQLSAKAPAVAKEGDKIVVVIGIADAAGNYIYKTVEGTVVGGDIVFDLEPDLWQSIQGTSNTQMLFYMA